MQHPPKYPSTPHWPWSETVHRDDSYHSNPEFFVGRDVVITEKLDGGNTCLWQGEVYARSTTQPSHAGWMAMVRKHHAWKTLGEDPRRVFYGEDLFGVHSIEYEAMPESQTFRLFAVRWVDGDHDVFLHWGSVAADSLNIDVPMVPVLFRGTFNSVDDITKWFREHLSKPSSLGDEREGFVMRVAEGFPTADFALNVTKYVRPNHVQTDEHWTRNWKPCPLT